MGCVSSKDGDGVRKARAKVPPSVHSKPNKAKPPRVASSFQPQVQAATSPNKKEKAAVLPSSYFLVGGKKAKGSSNAPLPNAGLEHVSPPSTPVKASNGAAGLNIPLQQPAVITALGHGAELLGSKSYRGARVGVALADRVTNGFHEGPVDSIPARQNSAPASFGTGEKVAKEAPGESSEVSDGHFSKLADVGLGYAAEKPTTELQDACPIPQQNLHVVHTAQEQPEVQCLSVTGFVQRVCQGGNDSGGADLDVPRIQPSSPGIASERERRMVQGERQPEVAVEGAGRRKSLDSRHVAEGTLTEGREEMRPPLLGLSGSVAKVDKEAEFSMERTDSEGSIEEVGLQANAGAGGSLNDIARICADGGGGRSGDSEGEGWRFQSEEGGASDDYDYEDEEESEEDNLSRLKHSVSEDSVETKFARGGTWDAEPTLTRELVLRKGSEPSNSRKGSLLRELFLSKAFAAVFATETEEAMAEMLHDLSAGLPMANRADEALPLDDSVTTSSGPSSRASSSSAKSPLGDPSSSSQPALPPLLTSPFTHGSFSGLLGVPTSPPSPRSQPSHASFEPISPDGSSASMPRVASPLVSAPTACAVDGQMPGEETPPPSSPSKAGSADPAAESAIPVLEEPLTPRRNNAARLSLEQRSGESSYSDTSPSPGSSPSPSPPSTLRSTPIAAQASPSSPTRSPTSSSSSPARTRTPYRLSSPAPPPPLPASARPSPAFDFLDAEEDEDGNEEDDVFDPLLLATYEEAFSRYSQEDWGGTSATAPRRKSIEAWNQAVSTVQLSPKALSPRQPPTRSRSEAEPREKVWRKSAVIASAGVINGFGDLIGMAQEGSKDGGSTNGGRATRRRASIGESPLRREGTL
eukprot:TRINITY_DN2349_c0_g1_i1.p1 TRINITY_DN2349_c0_g1~~TRINITY_DN2349_c0_g1_i1.p1  ORF type:complete len:866 (-),score=168.54 TRINITY_DN2349_c0_g1_i1:1107-3704(-)